MCSIRNTLDLAKNNLVDDSLDSKLEYIVALLPIWNNSCKYNPLVFVLQTGRKDPSEELKGAQDHIGQKTGHLRKQVRTNVVAGNHKVVYCVL